ncbi:MAG: hypothetical protein WC043_01640 [Pseudobdellovibrionaceae bacterium]
MSIDNARIFDDLTRVAGGAASILSALGKQLQTGLRDQMGVDVHSSMFGGAPANDDVERLQGVVTKLRLEQEELKRRVADLESLLGKKAKPAAKTKTAAAKKPAKAPAKKAAAKKTAARKK